MRCHRAYAAKNVPKSAAIPAAARACMVRRYCCAQRVSLAPTSPRPKTVDIAMRTGAVTHPWSME